MKTACFLLVLAALSSLHAASFEEAGRDGRVARIEVCDGLSPEPLQLSFHEEAGGRWQADEGETRYTVAKRQRGSLMEWVLIMDNRSRQEIRRQAQVVWDIPEAKSFQEYWSGSPVPEDLAKITRRVDFSNLREQAPWCGLLGARDVVFAGSNPSVVLSFIRSTYIPKENAGRLVYALRAIVPPGKKQEFRFFSADLPAPFGGERELVQRVHDAYPESFRPDPSASPVVWGLSAHYWMSNCLPEDIPGRAPLEFTRRMHASWEWSYAAFKRAGDHWGEEKWWDYEPLVPFSKKKVQRMADAQDYATMSREEFLRRRRDYFNRFRGGFGYFFYTPFASWVEYQLAQKEFPDAIIRDPNHKFDLKYYATGYDREFLVLPWFTSVEPVLKEHFRRIAETYDIHGFGFDVAFGGPRYRGPSVSNPAAPRAYDEQGDFIDLSAAAAQVIDFVKTLPARFWRGQRLSAVVNGMRSYNSAVRGDCGMFEGTPYYQDRNLVPLSRYLFGQKPATWWKGWAYHLYVVPNWKRQDRPHFLKTMRGVVDYTLFASYEWGNFPTLNYEWGVPKLGAEMSLLMDTVRRGWQSVFPVSFAWDGILHTARYGQGTQTRLFWGNPYDEARPVEARVDNRYLGEGVHVFASRSHGPEEVVNTLKDGQTAFSFPLAARQPVLFDAVASLPQNFSGQVRASLQVSDFSVRQSLEFLSEKAPELKILFPEHRGYEAPGVVVDGKTVAVAREGEAYAVKLPGGSKAVEAVYSSDLFHFSPEDLEAFPVFTPDFNPGFSCVADPKELAVLGNDIRLREFLSFYAVVVKNNPSPQPLAIVPESPGNTPVLAVHFDKTRIRAAIEMPDKNHVLFSVRDAAQLAEALQRWMAVLDHRFPWYPGFIATWGMKADLLDHVGMKGGVLEP